MTSYTAEERRILAQATALKKAKRKEANKHWNARKPAEKRHRGRDIDTGFLAYLRRQPCEARHMGGCQGPIEAAHVRYSDASRGAVNPGLQRRNHDRHANPLCHFHHQCDQHKRQEQAFWASIGKNAYDTAAAHYAQYRGQTPLPAETSQAGMGALQAPQCTHKIQSEQTNG